MSKSRIPARPSTSTSTSDEAPPVARLAMIFRRGRLTALSLLLASLVAPAHAEHCRRILSSKDPILLRGSSVTLFRGAVKPGLIAFHILRGEDSVKVLQM